MIGVTCRILGHVLLQFMYECKELVHSVSTGAVQPNLIHSIEQKGTFSRESFKNAFVSVSKSFDNITVETHSAHDTFWLRLRANVCAEQLLLSDSTYFSDKCAKKRGSVTEGWVSICLKTVTFSFAPEADTVHFQCWDRIGLFLLRKGLNTMSL
jgi:hypothetical protein